MDKMVMLAGTIGQGVMRSADNGESWQRIGKQLVDQLQLVPERDLAFPFHFVPNVPVRHESADERRQDDEDQERAEGLPEQARAEHQLSLPVFAALVSDAAHGLDDVAMHSELLPNGTDVHVDVPFDSDRIVAENASQQSVSFVDTAGP